MSLRRVYLSLDPAVYSALNASAQQRGVRVATLAGQMITSKIMGGAPDPPGQTVLPATPAAPAPPPPPPPPSDAAAAPEVPVGPEQERAQWLQLDRGRGWQTRMWELGEQLRADYPDLAEVTKNAWTADAFTRDGLLSLAVWREQLNTGTQPDPRLEHQWLAALRDLKRMLAERAGFIGAPALPVQRPADW